MFTKRSERIKKKQFDLFKALEAIFILNEISSQFYNVRLEYLMLKWMLLDLRMKGTSYGSESKSF